MRVLVQHHSTYRYATPAALGPHVIRLQPAAHARAHIEHAALHVRAKGPGDPGGDGGRVSHVAFRRHSQRDASGNALTRLTFSAGEVVRELTFTVELAVAVSPVNPFDFFVDQVAETAPFAYPPQLTAELAPYLTLDDPAYAGGPLTDAFLAGLPATGNTVSLLIDLNAAVNQRVAYVIREEPGIWTPEETLTQGRGSCRDSAVLLIRALRTRGLAARFASGYLVQLTDEGLLPDEPKGVDRDVVDLHAWAEVYLPGAGWIGLDATSGLLTGEGHIPLACTATPANAAPIEGTASEPATSVEFSMRVGRLGHEPRPTKPYTDAVWDALMAGADAADQRLTDRGLALTVGGEPTFNARDEPHLPEWTTAAMGASKWRHGLQLAHALRERMAPGAVIQRRQGKHYPGESLPRWALEIVGSPTGQALWRTDFEPRALLAADHDAREGQLRTFAETFAAHLGAADAPMPAFEDPWRHLQDEALLPVGVDPLAADLDDPEERRRLAKVLDRGLGRPVAYVLPVQRWQGAWLTERWDFRRGHLFLLPGDGPVGLRLPLMSLAPGGPPIPGPVVEPPSPEDPEDRDPRLPELDDDDTKADAARHLAQRLDDPRIQTRIDLPEQDAANPKPPSRPTGTGTIKTAVTIEARDDVVHVFLPPVWTGADYTELVAAVDAARQATGLDALVEGYPPPKGSGLQRFAVTPDPGVLEVNIPPARSTREYDATLARVFDAALHSGLHCETYMVDGRQQGSGGGNHITLGGPTAHQSPWLRRPDLLASLITFVQHHPSLSYLFSGLFVGPTSQAPRVDEGRPDTLYDLELALDRAHRSRHEPQPAPWLSDLLFRHLLTDLTGNTHRAEICLDKLYDPFTPHGRQGILEFRAFEMPVHPRMATAQVALMRALTASFVDHPYQHPLARWGMGLHDRFLLPHFLWQDLRDVLAWLAKAGLPLPEDGYRPFVELRCPVVGTLSAGPVTLEVRNAIEPWHVLGEQATATGTSRYVDSSMERIQVRVTGFVPERHALIVNGHVLNVAASATGQDTAGHVVPLTPTGTAGEFVAGIRFRAWAPPQAMHAHLGIHHPVRLDVVDRWANRSLGACAYHVWHPEGRAFDEPPLTRVEAAARRAQRFTLEGPLAWPVHPAPVAPHGAMPVTLDLRRLPIDRPVPVFHGEGPDDDGADTDGTGTDGTGTDGTGTNGTGTNGTGTNGTGTSGSSEST